MLVTKLVFNVKTFHVFSITNWLQNHSITGVKPGAGQFNNFYCPNSKTIYFHLKNVVTAQRVLIIVENKTQN